MAHLDLQERLKRDRQYESLLFYTWDLLDQVDEPLQEILTAIEAYNSKYDGKVTVKGVFEAYEDGLYRRLEDLSDKEINKRIKNAKKKLSLI